MVLLCWHAKEFNTENQIILFAASRISLITNYKGSPPFKSPLGSKRHF